MTRSQRFHIATLTKLFILFMIILNAVDARAAAILLFGIGVLALLWVVAEFIFEIRHRQNNPNFAEDEVPLSRVLDQLRQSFGGIRNNH